MTFKPYLKKRGYLFYCFQNQCIKIQEKEGRQKENKKRSSLAVENRKRTVGGGEGGTPIDGEYVPEKYGVPQIDNVDLDVLGLFTSDTDNASKCFIGEAEELIEEFLSLIS